MESGSCMCLLAGGIACCVGAASFYLIGRGFERDADFLMSVTRVKQLKDLASEVVPSVVAVWGCVGSDTPITSKHSGLLGTRHILAFNGKRIQDPNLKIFKHDEVPWYIDDGTGLGEWASFFKFSSKCLAVLGICLVAKHSIQYIRRYWEMQTSVATRNSQLEEGDNLPNEGDNLPNGGDNLSNEGDNLPNEGSNLSNEGSNLPNEGSSENSGSDSTMSNLRLICMEQAYNSVFVPCGHIYSCRTCSSRLTNCPLCRRRFDEVMSFLGQWQRQLMASDSRFGYVTVGRISSIECESGQHYRVEET